MMRTIRVAITGPDGAGKTTVCEELKARLQAARVIHAVKDRDHFLFTTNWAFKCYKLSKTLGPVFENLSKYFILYPFEYLENLRRFTLRGGRVIFYDRHPIDRVILPYELELNHKNYLHRIHYYVRRLWSLIYLVFFPRIDWIFVLLPTVELCLERSTEHARDLESTKRKIYAYRKAIEAYQARSHQIVPIEIEAELTTNEIADKVVSKIQIASKNDEKLD